MGKKEPWERANASLETLERENARMQRDINRSIRNIKKNLEKDPHYYDELEEHKYK